MLLVALAGLRRGLMVVAEGFRAGGAGSQAGADRAEGRDKVRTFVSSNRGIIAVSNVIVFIVRLITRQRSDLFQKPPYFLILGR